MKEKNDQFKALFQKVQEEIRVLKEKNSSLEEKNSALISAIESSKVRNRNLVYMFELILKIRAIHSKQLQRQKHWPKKTQLLLKKFNHGSLHMRR